MTRDEQRELLVAFVEWLWRVPVHGEVKVHLIDQYLASLPQPCGAHVEQTRCADGNVTAWTWTCELPAGHDGPHVENWGGGRRREWR
jgi:hypothetical protein